VRLLQGSLSARVIDPNPKFPGAADCPTGALSGGLSALLFSWFWIWPESEFINSPIHQQQDLFKFEPIKL
jgi:hypothetical protein